MSDAPKRKARKQAVLEVQATEQISPNLVRITAGGPGYENFNDNDATDKYAKILFAPAGSELTPPYDMDALRAAAPDSLPVRRTYTIRRSDPANQRVVIDFVVHGTEGVAGPWAANAQVGDTLVLSGAGGTYRPNAQSPWHLLIGDHTALPAISSAVEALNSDARGVIILSIHDASDRVLPDVPAGVSVLWVSDDAALLDTLTALGWPEGTPQVFAHGERGTIKQVRAVLKAHDVPREQISISAYWAQGRIEDQFQAEKREAIGQID